MYVEQGLYATHLKNWLRHFPREQILVVLMEDVAADPRAVSRVVYAFVGVDESFVPSGLTERYNRSFANRSPGLTGIKDAIYGVTRVPGMKWLWDAAAGAGLRSLTAASIPCPAARLYRDPGSRLCCIYERDSSLRFTNSSRC